MPRRGPPAARPRWVGLRRVRRASSPSGWPADPSAAVPPRRARPSAPRGAAALAAAGRPPLLLRRGAPRPGSRCSATARSSNVGWFAVCLLAGWCALAGHAAATAWSTGPRRMVLSRAEWLWPSPTPAGAPGSAGITFTVLAGLLIRHAARPGRAAAGRPRPASPSRPGPRSATGSPASCTTSSRHSLTVSLLHVAERPPGGRARPGRRGAGAGRGRAARPREPGRGARHGGLLRGGRRRRTATDAAAGRRRPARAGGAVPRRRAPTSRSPWTATRPAARHHGPGRLPHRAGGADQRGQARARRADPATG